MANTTNYNWETPDDTDLVKDGAAAIRTLGSSIDTTTKALNPSTTLGDIEYRSATANTNTRLAIGTTGQVLSVVGGVPAWATSDDANAIQNAIVDAKGDIVAASANDTPARLAVGTDNHRLIAASGETTGLKYVADTQNTVIDAEGDLLVGDAADALQRLAIGSNGNVLTVDTAVDGKIKWAAPAGGATFVGCQVYKSAQQTLTNNTETALTFNTERFDTDTFHDTSTNTSRMTIPSGKAGYYLVIATVTFLSNSTPARAVTLRLNGDEYAYLQQLQPVSNGGTITGGSYIINLAVADYIEIFARQESGGNLNVGAGSLSTSFTIQYLGA
jgi:hypothetical protein